MKTPWPWLTTDRDAALLPPHGGVRSVAPGPGGAAIWVSAEILPQVCPRVGGDVDSGKGNCSATDHVMFPSTPSSLLPVLSRQADRAAHHSLRLVRIATSPQLALDA